MKISASTFVWVLGAAMVLVASPALSQEASPAPSGNPTAQVAPASDGAATPAAATTAAPAASAAAPRKDEPTSYAVIKGGGWSLREEDIKESDLGMYVELAFGEKFNRFVGMEFGLGYLETEGKLFSGTAQARAIPLNIALRLGIPIAMIEPYVMLGGSISFTTIEAGRVATTTVQAGYHTGLGIDLNLGSFVVGLEGRYAVITGETFGESISLDGTTVALKAGVRF